MASKSLALSSAAFLFASSILVGAVPLQPQIQSVVSAISVENIAATQRKLESFGTRNIYSTTSDPEHGIGAAREWIAAQFKSYSPRLQVTFDKHRLAKQGRAYKDVEIWNVVAVLPGSSEAEREVVVSGHYDTINLIYKTGSGAMRELDGEATAAAAAPGVTDDGSGTAAVLELARVMSQHQFRKTIVFIAFAAEEYGLFGSALYAQDAAARHQQIEAVFNNDIIGSDVNGNGGAGNRYVNVYSEDPSDSPSRQVARYMKLMAERYQPGFRVHLIFRHDRFGRGGDHSPFNANGYAAVRVTTPFENFSHQHTATDTFANTAPDYTALVTRANAAAIAALSMAPKAPDITLPAVTEGRAYASPLMRGGGYDAVMKWMKSGAESDIAGYAIVERDTTAADWQREIYAGAGDSYTLSNVNIDEVVLGVKAIDKDGNESLVSVYVTPPYAAKKVVTY